MHEKAYQALTTSRTRSVSTLERDTSPKEEDDPEDELAILRGSTRLVSGKSPGNSRSRPGSLNSSPNAIPMPSFTPGPLSDARLSPPNFDYSRMSEFPRERSTTSTELYGWASNPDGPAQNAPWLTATSMSEAAFPGTMFSGNAPTSSTLAPVPSAPFEMRQPPVNSYPNAVDENMLDAWNSCMREVGFQHPENFEMWL